MFPVLCDLGPYQSSFDDRCRLARAVELYNLRASQSAICKCDRSGACADLCRSKRVGQRARAASGKRRTTRIAGLRKVAGIRSAQNDAANGERGLLVVAHDHGLAGAGRSNLDRAKCQRRGIQIHGQLAESRQRKLLRTVRSIIGNGDGACFRAGNSRREGDRDLALSPSGDAGAASIGLAKSGS